MEERRDGVMNTLTHMRSRATDSWTSASCVLHRKQRFHVSFADRSLEGMKKAMHSFVSTAHRLNENSVDVVQSDLPFFFSLSPAPRSRRFKKKSNDQRKTIRFSLGGVIRGGK